MEVRPADPEDLPVVRGICNAAMLSLEERALRRGETLVAVDDGRIVGALVLDGAEIHAVAVRPGRRDAGVGTALVEAAAARRDRLTAGFDPDVRPFYETLGFDVTRDGDRCRAVRASD